MPHTAPTEDKHTDQDTEMEEASSPPATAETATSKKRKRKGKPHILHSSTFKSQPNSWSYFHLRLITPGTAVSKPSVANGESRTSKTASQAVPSSEPLAASTPNANARPQSTLSGNDRAVENNADFLDFSSNNDLLEATQDIDPLTTSTLLTSALKAFLGLTGSSIPIDILKTQGRDVWIRVMSMDARAVRAGLSGWTAWCEADLVPGVGDAAAAGDGGKISVAWRVVGAAGTIGCLGYGDVDGVEGGRDLFEK